eukprot:3507231-Pleurochrysis_carterae.AAC.3
MTGLVVRDTRRSPSSRCVQDCASDACRNPSTENQFSQSCTRSFCVAALAHVRAPAGCGGDGEARAGAVQLVQDRRGRLVRSPMHHGRTPRIRAKCMWMAAAKRSFRILRRCCVSVPTSCCYYSRLLRLSCIITNGGSSEHSRSRRRGAAADVGKCLSSLSRQEMLPIRTMSRTAILRHLRGRSLISINVNSTYSLADCYPQLDSRSQQQQQQAELDTVLPF